MSPSLLIDRLESLLPEIKRSGDPSGTLLKFAAEENLAPAQLEKMAHQYNTAKTLAYMNKAANRGGSFSIIDTEDLLARYTQPEEVKEAGAKLSDWIDIPTEISTSRFPDIELLEMSQALKAAAAALPPETVEETPAEKYARESAEARNTETLRQVREDFQEATFEAFSKFATVLYDNELPFDEIEDDALCLLGKQAQALIPELVAYLDRSGIKVARMKKPAKRVLVRDRHGVMPILAEAADAFDVFQGADFILKGAATELEDPAYAQELAAVRAAVEAEKALGSGAGPTPDAPAGAAPSGKSHRESAPSAQIPSGTAHRETAPRGSGGGGSKGESKPKGDKSDVRSEGGGEMKPFTDEVGKGWDRYLDWGRNLRPLKDPVEGIRDLAAGFAGKNKKQERIDTAADDTTFQTGVERLIHTDPILSEADPAMVADLANSIRNINPQAALDLNYLKFTLREAIQYGALPHHTTKDLISMRRELAQAQGLEGERDDRLYGQPKTRATA